MKVQTNNNNKKDNLKNLNAIFLFVFCELMIFLEHDKKLCLKKSG